MGRSIRLPETKGENAREQFSHEQTREDQADIVEHVVGSLPGLAIEPLLATVLADVQANQKVGEDAADVGGDQHDHKVVAPFAGQEALQLVAQCPHPAVLAVDLDDVARDEVARLPQRGEILAVRPEEGCVFVGRWHPGTLWVGHPLIRFVLGSLECVPQLGGNGLKPR